MQTRGAFSNSGLRVWRPPNPVPGYYYVSPAGGQYSSVSGHLSEADSYAAAGGYMDGGSKLKRHALWAYDIV